MSFESNDRTPDFDRFFVHVVHVHSLLDASCWRALNIRRRIDPVTATYLLPVHCTHWQASLVLPAANTLYWVLCVYYNIVCVRNIVCKTYDDCRHVPYSVAKALKMGYWSEVKASKRRFTNTLPSLRHRLHVEYADRARTNRDLIALLSHDYVEIRDSTALGAEQLWPRSSLLSHNGVYWSSVCVS